MSQLPSPSSSPSSLQPPKNHKPSFSYDMEIFSQCQKYLEEKNHHGLALIARQKGLPPFLRFKIWPVLLKYHPFVLNPFIQPDDEVVKEKRDSDEDISDLEDYDESLKSKIRKDLKKYIQRLRYSSSSSSTTTNTPPNESVNLTITSSYYGELAAVELTIFEILEKSIFKFIKKWGKIIKYDQALTWIALGLAEWLPPVPKTSLVLVGRDLNSKNSIVKDILDDYSNYIDHVPGLEDYMHNLIQDESVNMSFHEVYERLVLVILHSPEDRNKNSSKSSSQVIINNFKIDKSTLPISGGTIEERVSFFIYLLRKLLPELSLFFQEEQILNKFGSNDDEWLIWWLKYGGAKVWSRLDRGRIWDSILGWRVPNQKNQRKNKYYYMEKMNIDDKVLDKLGPDVFWSVNQEDESLPQSPQINDVANEDITRTDSFRNLMSELHIKRNVPSSPRLIKEQTIPFAKIDPQIELIFIALALLKSKEAVLMELDQHEIRQFLSHLPTKSYNRSDKYKQYKEQKEAKDQELKELLKQDNEQPKKEKSSEPEESQIVTNNDLHNFKIDFIDNVINEAGDFWRKWLWQEMCDDN